MGRRATPAAVVGGGFVLWGLLIGLRPLGDNSFLTHLATGRLILDSGVPSVDPFTFSAGGEPWVVQSWLAAALYGVVERVGGGVGLVLLHAATTAVLAWLLWALSAPAGSLTARVALVGPALAVGSVAWRERPFLLAAVALALVMLVLQRWAPSGPGRGLRAWPWFVVPLVWLWANVHGSWPLAIAVPGAVAVGRWIDRDDAGQALWVTAGAAGGALLAAVGPLGATLWAFPLELAGRQDYLRYVAEWQRPDLTSPWQAAFAVQWVVVVVGLARRRSAVAAVLVVGAAVGAAVAVRNITLGSILLVAAGAVTLGGWGSLTGTGTHRLARPALAAIAAVALVSSGIAVTRDSYDLSGYPLRGLVRAGDLDGVSRLAAPDRVGNLREALDGPEGEVFVDDRFDMFPADVLDDLLDLELDDRVGTGRWREVLERRRIDAVLWPTDEALSGELGSDAAWRMVWSDARWALWVPSGP